MGQCWQQGDLVSPSQAQALGLDDESATECPWFIVISHSCDLAATADMEPQVELLAARIEKKSAAAAFANGHSIRHLGLPAQGVSDDVWLVLSVHERQFVDKEMLSRHDPNDGFVIAPDKRLILRRWLAQRYSRSAFPDMFVSWVQKNGVEKRMDKWAKRHSSALVGIYFDLDDDSESHHQGNPYELGINLVYDTANANHAALADQAADGLNAIFERCCLTDGQWRGIELLYCHAIADTAFPLRAAMQFRRWRFEHRSIAGEPVDTSAQ